ncbi:MAG: hypothetical protein K2F69_06650 [Bacteroidaceae bacterium]|nr:hypothetical protein [Bacteroidaceae bacterium]
MKKITSFLTVALLLGGFSTMKAQLVPELEGSKKVILSDEVIYTGDELTIGEGWYVLSQNRGQEGFMYDNVELDEGSVVRWKRGLLYANGEYAMASTMGPALVRFIKGETPGTYKVMFGTGRYISQLENENRNSQKLTAGEEGDAADLYVYVTETDGVTNDACFAINFATATGEYGDRVDTNDYANTTYATVVTWNFGLNTNSSGNNIWTIYPVEIEDGTEEDAAFAEFESILAEYQAKQAAFTGKTSLDGTPGTYNTELVALFDEAINEGILLESEYESYTAEEIREAGQKIIDTYNAAVESLVSSAMDITPGYYFIATHRKFYETVTPEVEEGEDPAESVTVWSNKYIFSKNSASGISAGWGALAEDETKATYLWKIEARGDKKYRVENAGTDATFTQSPSVMSLESDSLIQFDYIVKAEAGSEEESDTIFYSLRLAREAGNANNSFHANNHASGAGKQGNIVKWTSSDWPSQWALIPVSDEDAAAIIAAYGDTKADELLQIQAKQILTEVEPKMNIALDVLVEADLDNPLITDVSQLSSPYTCSESMEPGSGLDKLIDDDKNGTYWHSIWSGDGYNIATGHYLQVELTNPSSVEAVAAEIGRRSSAQNDHPVAFDVYGTDNPDAAKTECTLLGKINVPFTTNSAVEMSSLVPTQGKTYLRYYATDCTGSETRFRTYWHAAHFQLYPAVEHKNEHSQAVGMGEIFTNMQAAVDAAKADGDTITTEHCNALIAAYEAFNTRFVNPDALRSAVSDNKNVPASAVQGDQPGFWSQANAGQALAEAIAVAEAYDKAGVLYPETSANHVKAIEAAKKAMFEAANKVQTGKWYNFRFATEQMYEENEWSKTGADAHLYSEEDGDVFANEEHWPSLYGKLLSIGREETIDTDSNFVYESEYEDSLSILGHRLYVLDEAETESTPDAALFRFINVADTAYIIQNKATGLYLRAAGTAGAVTLSIQPTLWKNSAMGYGKVMSKGNDILGNNNNNLHTQRDGNFLVTWSSENVDSNTGFLIEEAEDVAADYAKNDFTMLLAPNAIYGFCYPMDVTPAEGANVYGVSISGTEITLNVLENNTAKAGEPFVYVTGTEDFDEEAAEELYGFTYGGTLNVVADTVARHIGSYFATTAPKGSVIANGEGAFKAVRTNTAIPANRTWINAQLESPKDAEISYTVGEGVFDAIKDAVANATKGGKIYTVDGTYVGKGDINTVKGLKKGLYIVNGVKVLVK